MSTVKPFKPVSRDTIGRWVKDVLKSAGINLKMFSCHSTRSASASCAAAKGVPLQTIIDTAGWTNDSSFRRFYEKPVTRDGCFANAILNKD